jgi:hypothetical protein
MAAMVTRAIGPLCDKVEALFYLFDFNETGEISHDESVMLLCQALSGIVRLEKLGNLPEDGQMHKITGGYWRANRVFNFQDKLIDAGAFQTMVRARTLRARPALPLSHSPLLRAR